MDADDLTRPRLPVELDEFLDDTHEQPYDWLVPGLIERRDRIVLTATEGAGKSTLLRQFGVQLSSGIHPFTLEPIEPVRVLYVDLENSARHIRRHLHQLRVKAGSDYKPTPGMYVEVRPAGIDMLDRDDANWLRDITDTIRPGLLMVGPVYKMSRGDPLEEGPARTVAAWLDAIRHDTGCSLILEAHSPYAGNGRKRPTRPYGASLWSRWPEFGLNLAAEGQLTHWRPARDERDWPAQLQRGGEWPWTTSARPRDHLWAHIVELCQAAGDQLSQRDLADLTGASATSVRRAIAEHPSSWEALEKPDQEALK